MADTSKVPEDRKKSEDFKRTILNLQEKLEKEGVEFHEIDLGNRKFLQALRRIALDHSRHCPENLWAAAYGDLAKAADKLDAYIARTETPAKEE